VRSLNHDEPPGYDDGFGRQQAQVSMPRLTPVTRRLLILNGAIFLASFVIGVGSPTTGAVLFNLFGLSPEQWDGWFPFVPFWQLLTFGFLHSTMVFSHILWNMVQLYFFGTMLEGILGSRRFLTFYIVALCFGGLLHLAVEFASGGQMPVIGASGAVLGVVVATASLRPRAQVFVLFIPVTLMVLAGVIVAIDVLSAVRDLSLGISDGVAHWVHLGGALCGFVCVRMGWIQVDWVGRLMERRVALRDERRAQDDYDMDALLAKIHSQGLAALTKREKEFLKRVSNRK
jgi:membrane associated rhomboid family serine protease